MLKTLFLDLLKEPSITPNPCNCFKICKDYLPIFEYEEFNKNEVSNIVLSKEFSNSGIHIAFCGHIDVVPTADGWQSDPFIPIEEDGKIIARGTQDMKSGVAAMIDACKQFVLEEEVKNIRKISIILTSDEEGDGIWGTRYVLECLKARNDLADIALVCEPTSNIEFADTIKIGRRGSIHATIKVLGKQGHVAYPSKCDNPVHNAALSLSKIAGALLDNGDEFFEPSRIIITNLKAGIGASNVTPNDFEIKLNVRNSPLSNEKTLEDFIKNAFLNVNYELDIKVGSKPFVTAKDSLIVKALLKAMSELGYKEPELNSKGGTSDARFLAEYGVEVCELGVKNDLIHAVNESVDFKEVEQLRDIILKALNILNKKEF